ncbi:MAG: sugar ABC transporter ATP-binding protein [Phycisphaerae bacterium]|nr:sugar ABC transporter ATP-binding protein [Phycisphaerae bacterium]
MVEGAEILRAEGVSKRFGVTRALDDVTVSLVAGEVHALMGENGAGKSTLGKVMAGLHRQDSGRVVLFDAGPEGVPVPRELVPGSIEDAYRAGVRIVHQELAQCPNLTVAENVCLHDMPTRRGVVDRAAMVRRARRLLRRLDPAIDVEATLATLPPGHRQIVQIACALDEREGGSRARVIVFDEPTSSLSVAETDRLLAIIRQLAAGGLTVVYVSHRMGEIFAVCDRVTVLRDGRYVATSPVGRIDEPTLVEQMIGRRLSTPTRASHLARQSEESAVIREVAGPGRARASGRVVLSVDGVSSPGRVERASLAVRAGEVVGLGGLVGSGRSEVLDAIFGVDRRARGRVRVDDAEIEAGRRSTVRRMIRAGVGYVPEDRRLQGLFFQLGIDENLVAPVMPMLARGPGVRGVRAERALVTERMRSFQIKAASPRALPGALSGGNQQKVLIARWMGPRTRVLLLDEPTRGIDVGTKAEIYRLIREAAERGAAVLLVTSEMPELLALSDRILVMCDGRIAGELAGDDATQANVLRLATIDSRVA